jgi:hypothetical protein
MHTHSGYAYLSIGRRVVRVRRWDQRRRLVRVDSSSREFQIREISTKKNRWEQRTRE